MIMSLAWWSIEYARNGDDGGASRFAAAISDVSWVLSNLVSVLSTDGSAFNPVSPPAESSTFKIGRPSKRLCLR